MQLQISKKFNVSTLTEKTKIVTRFLWFPILEFYPTRLVWWEWVTYTYNQSSLGKWVKTGTLFHEKRWPN